MARRSTTSLAGRLRALAEAAELAEGRVPAEPIVAARKVTARATGRLAITGDATVVAVAGATGSGKSSMVNALAGVHVTEPGVRRPTTSHPVAAVFGADQAELLDWLDIRSRHRLDGTGAAGETLEGLVLLDLPDHDSTEATHRAEVDRLVELVDVLVWVLDPQKYADAALHEQYLVPFARHARSMLVLLNQVDLLSDTDRETVLRDLRALLDAEGLHQVEVVPVSTVTGEGIADVRAGLGRQVVAKRAATQRISADVTAAAVAVREAVGSAPAEVATAVRRDLHRALSDAAGVPMVTEAVGQAWRRRGGLATGWPVLAWLANFRPDPLRRLHLGRLGVGRRTPAELEAGSPGRTSLPQTSGVQLARVDAALRDLIDGVTDGMHREWADSVRSVARARRGDLPDRLDRAVATTDLDLDRHRNWWQVVRVLQWLLLAVAVAGLAWFGLALLLAYLQFPPLPDLRWREIPIPSLLLVGGVVGGLVVAAASRIGVEVGARRRARLARRRLQRAIGGVASELVIDPITAELERHATVRERLDQAAG